MSCQERFKQEAITMLEALRQGNGMFGYIGAIQQYLKKSNSTPEDLGTNEQELLELEKKLNIQIAKHNLEKARRGKTTDPQDFWWIERHLEDAGLKLEDINTSEQEILALRKKWYLKQIADRLEKMRTKPICQNPHNVGLILTYIRLAPCTFEEIGITEQELHALGQPTSSQS